MATILYNSYNLQTNNIITEKILHTGSPEKTFETTDRPRRSGSFLMANLWREKVIRAEGNLLGSSIADLDARIDELKQKLTEGENLNLDIGYAGGTRRYLATARRVEMDRERFNGVFIPFRIDFVCADPFGRDTSLTTESLANQTSSPFSKVFTMAGSVPAYPTIDIHFDAENAITQVEVENTTTGDSIVIAHSYSISDDLEIDCYNQTVKVNSTEVDFSGVFPSFIIGSNTVEVTITGTSFQVDLDISYYNLYL